jgi:hypothetical protein
MAANERQVGGTHYKTGGEEHWDRVYRLGLDYFQAQITKYVERCWKKNGVQDLEKARHFLDKYIEISKENPPTVTMAPTPQHPHVESYGSEIAPTGWIGYTFEGADSKGFLFTCDACKGHFYAPAHSNPNNTHKCHDSEGTTQA